MAAATWTDTGQHPWRRYAARLTDMLTIGLAISIIGGFVAYGVAPDAADAWLAAADTPVGRFRDTIILLVLMAPISAAFIGATGLSPGKWIFGVRVSKDGAPIGFAAAVRRELSILLNGWGLGIPLLSLVTLFSSFNRLTKTGVMPWDERTGITVTHRPESPLKLAGMWATMILVLAVNIMLATA